MLNARGLLLIALLGCGSAAVFGAAPLAAWVDGSIANGTAIQQAADAWLHLTQRIGLDRPYDSLRREVRDAEAAHFGGDN
jgi:hypothetical protein